MISAPILFIFLVKHFIADFMLQNSYQYLNKGNLKHPGGYVHAGIHVGFTGIILCMMTLLPFGQILLFMTTEFVIHYVLDYSKVVYCKSKGITPVNSELYWVILGADQLAHYLTYLGILMLI